ncbi:MAG TPA: hypothetical protein VMV44_05440 [Rectinemataceae bacterium]|nr:hypothetical protein [Rectinemataceae bacterium]
MRLLCFLALPLAAMPAAALEVSLRASINAGSGSLHSDMLNSIGDSFSALGSLSASSTGRTGPGIPLLGEAESSLLLSNDNRLGFSVGIGYGNRGAAIIAYDSSGTGIATALVNLPLLEAHVGLTFSLPVDKDAVVAEAGLSGGLLVASPTLDEWMAGVHSSTGFPLLAGSAALGGLYMSVAWEHPLGMGAIDLGLAGDLGLSSLALDASSANSALQLPWRLMLRVGYRISLWRSAA